MKLLLTAEELVKAEQMGLFGHAPNTPPGTGWGAIPHGKHGGYRRHGSSGSGYEYWYPGQAGVAQHPHPEDVEPEPVVPRHHAYIVSVELEAFFDARI